MQRLITWLANKIFRHKQPPELSLRQTGAKARVMPRATGRKRVNVPNIDFSAELGGRIEDAGPGKNVLIRNKYVREDTGTHDTLKIIDDSILDSDEECGLDPYNTGRFDRSKSWDSSRSRK